MGGGEPCSGACGWWQGLAGQRADAPSEARGADGSRAGRRPPAHAAAGPGGARNASGTTQQYQKPCGALPWYRRAAATTVSDKSRT